MKATGFFYLKLPAGQVQERHPAPRRQYVIALSGRNEIELADGDYRESEGGDHHSLLHDRSLDSLRSHQKFTELVNRAEEMDLEARTVFLDNGGDRLLGVRVDRKPSGRTPADHFLNSEREPHAS